ncbi:BTAD domain-containing putative transcriptional regulator [Nocardioides flavescens]|uniref:BTAD domain-containing putative transcriptional regulator n=1 Tax=Nocardioides flavescens TaxID=2691959 RepID=UPI00192711EA
MPTAVRLELLDDPRWSGAALSGGRTHTLLAALALAGGRAVADDRLVEDVWDGVEAPANPAKALQVVVSRTRSQTAAGVVERVDGGYRLGLEADEVDALALDRAVREAREAESRGEQVGARDRARAALALTVAEGRDGALGVLRQRAEEQRAVARAVLGRALSALGEHDEALALLDGCPDDEPTVVALLRSTAAARGVPAALERFERHRGDLADRLGVDPGPQLQALHAELLASDRPVREGVRYAASELVGRDEDLRALRAAVRESRVVSILGPGGLGKTTLAHLLGLEAEQPVVRFVELVGVSAPEDLVGEVGSALGVRDSLSGRSVLTPDQRADVRTRIAHLLDQAPTLLVLDNCEQVVGAVADLVAHLVATCRRLRVVTTTRAPLAIAAERVFALGQLDDDAAAALFVRRAASARPGVALDPDAVRRVVRRLDGLPLAVELAAARVRSMSVEDVDRRLVDRFALLRGGDRSAPDRHQTLLAVLDWSWNLLDESQRRAVRWLSVFPDGFTLSAAEHLLGPGAVDDVPALVDQSLLSVLDVDGSVRFRMLETVREFGRMQLVGAGEDAAARAGLLTWARERSRVWSSALWSSEQVETVRAVAVEESNLSDCLRDALVAEDPAAVADLVALLATFWTIRGEHSRVIAVTPAVDRVFDGWTPGPDEVGSALAGAAVVVMNAVPGDPGIASSCAELLRRSGANADQRSRGIVAVLAALDLVGDGVAASLGEVAAGEDRIASVVARMWTAHQRENDGDPQAAIAEASAGLARTRADLDGPWLAAGLRTMVASLHAQLGDHAAAAEQARLALTDLDALDAVDDAVQVRSLLALDALTRGDLGSVEHLLAEIDALGRRRTEGPYGGAIGTGTIRAELALVRGETSQGLALYREAVARVGEASYPSMFPAGAEPWVLFVESAAVAAYARSGASGEGRDLFDDLRAKVPAALGAASPQVGFQVGSQVDFPITGTVLFAVGSWALHHDALPAHDAVAAVLLAERFSYARYTLSLALEPVLELAERRAPDTVAALREEYAERRGPDLLEQARALGERLASPVAHIRRP